MSSPLLQQELLEAAPARRLIVPRGFSSHWGVDVSVSRVSVAFAASDGRRGARTASFAKLDGGARLAHIWAETACCVSQLVDEEGFPRPGLVMVEQPSGARPNPSLSYAVGVVMGAIAAELAREGPAVAVETCVSSWWKKTACGKGNIYKPKRGEPTESYGVLVWARANGYAGFSYDEADALGIAEAARRSVALDER